MKIDIISCDAALNRVQRVVLDKMYIELHFILDTVDFLIEKKSNSDEHKMDIKETIQLSNER